MLSLVAEISRQRISAVKRFRVLIQNTEILRRSKRKRFGVRNFEVLRIGFAKPLVELMKSDPQPGRGAASENFGVRGLNSEVRDRLREAVKAAGGNRVVSERSGVPASTLYSAIEGISDPKSSNLAAIAKATGRSLDWLMYGADPSQAPAIPAPSDHEAQADASSIDVETLGAVIALVEDWLTAHRRTLPPAKKGEIAASIYQIVMEDAAAGVNAIDTRKVKQFLRLVA